MHEAVVISSLIVHARPAELAVVRAAIAAMPGAEIHADDAAGRLIVVLETASDRELTEMTIAIGAIGGVVGVNLVYHHTEGSAAKPAQPIRE